MDFLVQIPFVARKDLSKHNAVHTLALQVLVDQNHECRYLADGQFLYVRVWMGFTD